MGLSKDDVVQHEIHRMIDIGEHVGLANKSYAFSYVEQILQLRLLEFVACGSMLQPPSLNARAAQMPGSPAALEAARGLPDRVLLVRHVSLSSFSVMCLICIFGKKRK